MRVCCHLQLFATPWTPLDRQAPLFMGFPRQEYWSGLPFPSPRDLPDSGIEPMSHLCPALAGAFFATVSPGKVTGGDGRVGKGETLGQMIADSQAWRSETECCSALMHYEKG